MNNNDYRLVVVADRSASMKVILNECGYSIYRLPHQVTCPFHKLGEETRPSARIYEDDSFMWCFTCLQQYYPTDVWAALRNVDRIIAAQEILARWSVSEERQQEIIRHHSVPRTLPISEAVRGTLERRLLAWRGVAVFATYRYWTVAVDRFLVQVNELPEPVRDGIVRSFCDRMDMQLSRS